MTESVSASYYEVEADLCLAFFFTSSSSSSSPNSRSNMPFSQLPETSIVFPLDIQSLPVPGSETPGYTPIYRNAAVPEIHTKENTYDAFAYGRNAHPKSNCLGWRPWNPVKKDFENTFKWWTYEEVEELRTVLGSALVGLQKKGEIKGVGSEDWVVALWMQNRPEYQVFDQATAAYTLTTVALYDSYDTETSVYVLSHSEAKVVATTSSHLSAVLSSKSQLPHLDVIVLLDESSGLDPKSLRPGELSQIALARQWGALAGVKVYTLAEMLENGRKETLAHNPPLDNNKIASLCYTSGTTGKPKGAFVAHRQLALAAAAVGFVIKEPQLMLSYLPLAHIYERALETVCLRTGSAIGYFSGDTLRLIEDAQILKPTFFPSVPRVLNRIAAQVQAQADGEGLKAKLLRHAIAVKVAHHDATGEVTHAFYDRLVFSKVQAVLGGRVKIIISGSAPIRPDVLKLLRVCLAADVREGYGQTENAGLCLIMNQWDPNLGSCGPPVVGTELRLKDCPELGYTAADKPFPRGEILSRGQATFPGYYKDPEKTAETLDSDGWLHSGDVGLIDQYGRIKIIDRVKNLVKLSQGEYVAIENVEGLYGSCPLIAQLWLYGDSLQAHLVSIAVPEPSTFAPFASKVLGRTIAPEDIGGLEAACADPKVIQAVIIELAKVSKKEKMKGYEYIRALKLRMDPFTLENGLLTPTFKMKRPEAKKILKADLDALYAQEPADVSVAKL